MRARRIWWMGAALMTILALDALVGGVSLSVPALFGGGASFVFLRTYTPLLWAAAIADTFAGRGLSVEARPMVSARCSASRLGLLDAVLFLLASSITATLFSGLPFDEVAGVGPVLVLSGVTCIAVLRAGPAVGVFTSTVLMLLTSVYPRTAPAARFIHILQPDGQPVWSMTCGIVACLAAAGMLATNSVVTRLRADVNSI